MHPAAEPAGRPPARLSSAAANHEGAASRLPGGPPSATMPARKPHAPPQKHPGGTPLMPRRLIPAGVLALLAAGLYFAQAQDKVKRSDAELKAMAKIRQHGGLVLELAQNDPRLEVSYLQKEGKFSDDYLTPLKDLKEVVHLNLRGQDVTDAHLTHLKGLTSLTRLHLEKTKVTDKGLENLKGLTNLEYLNLYGTDITDAGLVNLEGMKKLKHLYLWQTKVTDAGVARLKKALPQVEIVRGLDLEKPKEEPKKDAPKKDKDAPKKDAPKKDKDAPKKDAPKKDKDAPKKDAPKKDKDAPKKDADKK